MPLASEPKIDYLGEAKLLRAMAHPIRLLLLELIYDLELPVKALEDQTDLPQAVISTHLAVLRRAGLVSARTYGTARLYRIADKRILQIIKLLNPKLS